MKISLTKTNISLHKILVKVIFVSCFRDNDMSVLNCLKYLLKLPEKYDLSKNWIQFPASMRKKENFETDVNVSYQVC